MKRFSLISLLFFALLAGGCGASKTALSHDAVVRDSVSERLKIVTRTEIVPVYVQMNIPEIRELRRNVKDSTDVIENEYAKSTVTLHPDGSFDHGLETKAQKIEKAVEVPVQVTDTSAVKESFKSSEEKEIITKTVEVNVLRWWQKALMWCGVTMLAIVIIWLAKTFLLPQTNTVLTAIKTFLKVKY